MCPSLRSKLGGVRERRDAPCFKSEVRDIPRNRYDTELKEDDSVRSGILSGIVDGCEYISHYSPKKGTLLLALSVLYSMEFDRLVLKLASLGERLSTNTRDH
jgi:hypothetical protein